MSLKCLNAMRDNSGTDDVTGGAFNEDVTGGFFNPDVTGGAFNEDMTGGLRKENIRNDAIDCTKGGMDCIHTAAVIAARSAGR